MAQPGDCTQYHPLPSSKQADAPATDRRIGWFGRRRALLLVVAAHAALLWLWSPGVTPASPPERRTTVVVVVPPARLPAPEPRSDERVANAARRAPSDARPARAARRERVVEALPDATSSASIAAAPAAAPASASASAPKPLDFALRPGDALRTGPLNAAVNDPRANAPRLSRGERMAQTLGSDTRLYEEIQPDGSVRLRRGTSCLDARQPRAAGLDPYNSAIAPKPRLMSAC